MKKIVFFSAICLAAYAVFAQTAPPQKIRYQAVVRDNTGAPVKSDNIRVVVSILRDSETGSTVYREGHQLKSNEYGLINFEIGDPDEVLNGNFAGIDWGATDYFVKLEIDINATGYTDMKPENHLSTSQLVSVPYALYAKKSDTAHFAQNADGGGIPYDLEDRTIPLFVKSNGDSLVNSNITQDAAGNVFVGGRLNIGSEYRFPTTAGGADQILVLQANGDLEWAAQGGGNGNDDENWLLTGTNLRNLNLGNVTIGGGPSPLTVENRGIFWNEEKKAFRAGFNYGTWSSAWDALTVGQNSIGLGSNIIAGSTSSFAMGRDLRVNNWGAPGIVFAIGDKSLVDDGDNSFSVGVDNEIMNAINSMTVGVGNKIENTDNLYVNVVGNDNRIESSDNVSIFGGLNMVTRAENSLILGSRNGEAGDRITDIRNGFIFGEGNIVLQTSNSLVLGKNNRVNLGSEWNPNELAIVIGKGNNLQGDAADNVVMGLDNAATGSNNILIGSGNDSENNSIYIGYENFTGTFGAGKADKMGEHNIALGRKINFNGYAQNSIAIGQRIQGMNDNTHAFAGNSSVNIGNDIYPMRNASYSVNIGSAIETRSDTSINIGYNIKSIHPRGYQTINIGRNITNNASDMSVSGNNAIAIGENISITNAPYSISIGSNIVYGRRYTGSQRYHNDDAIVIGHSNDTSNYPWIPANPFSVLTEASYRNAGFWIPKRSTGSGATYSPAFNLLYIDAVGNAFFGVQTMSHAGSIPTLYAPPSAGDPANGIPPNAISGRVYARDFYSLGGQTTWTPSDRRLKRNIKPLSRDYTDYLYRLRPFSYNYDLEGVDPEKIVWGFMAQDVQRWFPHLVEGTEETSMSLNYSGFIPILWKINQDQQIKLDEQQARIEELERQIETINYFLEEIKEKLK